ncbi:unnamed protein product [Heligmosomoides polygyrus]|uniref:DUF4806 domain-containing protein n=1 Tax=Heligmosomoides polygyrus TaxID=6339 RepID=A0A183G0F0_HELPZ|nr:unnamed protein product [Heligmosomoides polygyrus]
MQKRSRMADQEILNAIKDDIFPTDLSSLIDDVISAQNAESAPLEAFEVGHNNRVRSALSALSGLMKKIYQKSSDETFELSIEFGALDVPPGEFTIPPSSYGPEYVNFFNKFIHHVVSEAGVRSPRDVWPRLTTRTRKRKNHYVDFGSELVINFVKVMYEKANKEIRTSFYFDVFNMVTVALTNFSRNMKSQEAREQSTSYAAAESDTIPSRPTNGGLEVSQRTVSSAESDASMALSFFDYSQE